ncbi:MAG: glycosyltransferase family 4 protein [Elusimicrobiales bacterium]
MNLALILHALSVNNGVSRVVLSHAREFSACGHTVHLYASRLLLPEEEKRALPPNIFLHRFPCLRGSNRLWATPFGALLPFLNSGHDLVVSHLLTVRQDVIVMHNDPQPVEVEKLSAVPFTIDRPRLRTRNRVIRTFIEKKRFAPGRYKSVVALSRRSAGEISTAYGVEPGRIRTIRHGVDALRFSPAWRAARRASARAALALSPEELAFVYIGDSWKGLEFAIRGLAAARRPGNSVLVASGPFHEQPFSDLASDLGLKLICKNDWADIRDLYSAGDVFINPTPMDTFGLAVLEAMAMGLAVITTKYAGVSEFFKDGENAFILDRPWDTGAIAGLADRLGDQDLRRRLCARGVELASALSWKEPAREHLELYEELVKRRRK